MKFSGILSAMVIVAAMAVSACSKSAEDTTNNPPPGNPPASNTYPKPKTLQEMSDLLASAIKSLTSSLYLDMSVMNVPDNQIDITLSNAYNTAINNDNSLKYAYRVIPIYNSTAKVLQCEIKYMPYKLGIDPNTVPAGTKKITSYNDLIAATINSPLGLDIPIAITNKNLDVNTMQQVMNSQCGYGYLVYTFNTDATAITCYPPPKGLPGAPNDMNDCVSRINRLKDSVTKILMRIVTPGMTNDQKLTAIYNYVTPVFYDYNYNTPNLTFDSQTGFGVFVNKKAVCGGYSWAFNMLANAAGIQCYNVSGSANNIGHAWSTAQYNGGYYYFDATWDHGLNPYRYFAKTESYFLQNMHTWNNTMVNALVAEK